MEIFNPLLGCYEESGTEDVSKSNDTKWPSISGQVKEDDDEDEEDPLNFSGAFTGREGGSGFEKGNNPKWPSMSSSTEEDNDDDEAEHFERDVPIFIDKAKGDQHICYGIVYEPDTIDAQGDSASAEEIKKAAYHFMEHVQKFKVMHKGESAKIKVLESYVAPKDLVIAKRSIKKGSWILVTRVLDKKVWKDIKDGKLTGYSMAGYAKIA